MKYNTKIIIYSIIALLIAVGAVYGFTQRNKKPAKNYTQQEVKSLSPEEQKKIWEKQISELQSDIKNLKPGTDENSNKQYDLDKSRVYIKLAQAYNGLGKYQESIDALNNIPESQKTTPAVYEAYVVAYGASGQNDKVDEVIKKAIADGDNSPNLWIAYVDSSNKLPAEQRDAIYNQALQTTKNNLDIVISYAKFLESVGNKEKAIIYWETARNSDPDRSSDYEKEIARLRQ